MLEFLNLSTHIICVLLCIFDTYKCAKYTDSLKLIFCFAHLTPSKTLTISFVQKDWLCKTYLITQTRDTKDSRGKALKYYTTVHAIVK